MTRLLIIEDDAQVREALVLAMQAEGHEVVEAASGGAGIATCATVDPELVLLDLRLPDVTGFDVCRRLRDDSDVPIIVVTAQDDTHDLVAALEAGADDYVTKPVEPKALAARIRALLRRVGRGTDASRTRRFGHVELRADAGEVRRHGEPVHLTRTEFRLLCELADRPGQVLSRDQLLDRVWGQGYFGDARIIDAHIRRLRVKIEESPDDPQLVVTVQGLGYRLAGGPDEPRAPS